LGTVFYQEISPIKGEIVIYRTSLGSRSPGVANCATVAGDRDALGGLSNLFWPDQESRVIRISQILKDKGDRVVTIEPDATIAELVGVLQRERIGAVVVMQEKEGLAGIISERDVAHGLAEHGAELLAKRVADLMTREVVTCTPESNVEEVMKQMTVRRFRHLPVVKDGALVGVISIGDVVKKRLDELETETTTLQEYITGRR